MPTKSSSPRHENAAHSPRFEIRSPASSANHASAKRSSCISSAEKSRSSARVLANVTPHARMTNPALTQLHFMPPFISTVTCPTRRGVRPFASVFATSAEHFHFFAPTKELHQPSPFENRGIISYLQRGVNAEALRALGAGLARTVACGTPPA